MAAATSAATSDTGTRCAGGEGREGAWRGSDAKEDARWSDAKEDALVETFVETFASFVETFASFAVTAASRRASIAAMRLGGGATGDFPNAESGCVAGWVESRRRRAGPGPLGRTSPKPRVTGSVRARTPPGAGSVRIRTPPPSRHRARLRARARTSRARRRFQVRARIPGRARIRVPVPHGGAGGETRCPWSCRGVQPPGG